MHHGGCRVIWPKLHFDWFCFTKYFSALRFRFKKALTKVSSTPFTGFSKGAGLPPAHGSFVPGTLNTFCLYKNITFKDYALFFFYICTLCRVGDIIGHINPLEESKMCLLINEKDYKVVSEYFAFFM